MREPKVWRDCPPKKPTCQLEFFDFENSNDSQQVSYNDLGDLYLDKLNKHHSRET